jgi:hypothetical protein
MKLIIFLILTIFLTKQTILSVKIKGTNDFTDIELGNINILISIPHDGSLIPNYITNRTYDIYNKMNRDWYTKLVADGIRDELSNLFRLNLGIEVSPFIVSNHLHRYSIMYTFDLIN